MKHLSPTLLFVLAATALTGQRFSFVEQPPPRISIPVTTTNKEPVQPEYLFFEINLKDRSAVQYFVAEPPQKSTITWDDYHQINPDTSVWEIKTDHGDHLFLTWVGPIVVSCLRINRYGNIKRFYSMNRIQSPLKQVIWNQ